MMNAYRRAALLATAVVAVCLLIAVPKAYAVTSTVPSTTISAVYTGATNVTYTFTGFTLANSQQCTGISITFPANTDVSAATAISPAATTSITGQTVTLTFATVIAKGSAVSVAIGGISNPSTAVTQTAGPMTFMTTRKNGVALPNETLATGSYSVVAPYLTLSVNPPTIHFDLTPGTASPPQAVTLAVDSSHPVLVTRDLTGDVALIGLSVTGGASGAYLAGASTLVDQYSADVPWTTEGGLDYAVTVTYTVVQQ